MKTITKTREQLRAENLAQIQNFRLMDDTYMTAFFNEQPELVQFVLRIIMNKDDLIVTSSRTQKPMKNMQGRSVTLDVDAVDKSGTVYDIEVQQANYGAKPKRARFHSSMLDSDALMPTDDFEKLPETYVIFITSEDYWKSGLPIYTINRHIEEADMKLFDDKSHILYVNGSCVNDTPLGKLMHDFKCVQPKEMYYSNLAERAHYLKETEGGCDSMCEIMEKIGDERERQKAYRIAMNFIRMGINTLEDIAKATDLTMEEVRDLAEIVKNTA